ncbi:MAG: hypothetical protein J7494_08820 [Sphingobium sp.]|nr:hypothetical protein [Sphingobium sp.]
MISEELGQVCLDPHGIQFKFDSLALSVQFEIEHIEADGTRHSYDCTAHVGPPLLLHRLLQKSVKNVERDELAFTLFFEDGARLIVHSELGPYECWQLCGCRKTTG